MLRKKMRIAATANASAGPETLNRNVPSKGRWQSMRSRSSSTSPCTAYGFVVSFGLLMCERQRATRGRLNTARKSRPPTVVIVALQINRTGYPRSGIRCPAPHVPSAKKRL